MREISPLSPPPTVFAAQLGELAKQVGLLVGKLRRHLDDEFGTQVAAAPALQPRHAALAEHELLARLRTGRDGDLLVTIERRQLDRGPQGGLGDRHGDHRHEVVAVAEVALVRLDAQVHVEVTGAAATRTCGAASGQPQRRAAVDSCRHVDLVGVLGRDTALAPARRARGDDDLAEPAAARARRRRDHLPEQALADTLNLAAAVAVDARHRLRAAAGSGAVAVGAALRQAQGHRHRRAEHRLLERDRGDRLHVLAPRWPARPATCSPAEPTTEQRAEQITDPAREDVVERRAAARGSRHARLAEAVVASPLFGIGQHLVRPGHRLELLGGTGVRIGVGMQFARLAPVRPLQLVGARGPRHAEQLVEVSHRRPPRPLRTVVRDAR